MLLNTALLNTALLNAPSGPAAPPRIDVDTSNPNVGVPYGAADPAPIVRAVTNGGGGGLFPSLDAVTSYQVGELTGWLAAVTALVAGQWQLTFTVTKGILVPRFYHAVVTLSTPSAPDVNIPFTLQVQPSEITTAGHATARRANDSVIPSQAVRYEVDQPWLVACDAATGAIRAIAGTDVPVVVTESMSAGGQTATRSFTVWPPNSFSEQLSGF